jgi:hypothetical protein
VLLNVYAVVAVFIQPLLCERGRDRS